MNINIFFINLDIFFRLFKANQHYVRKLKSELSYISGQGQASKFFKRGQKKNKDVKISYQNETKKREKTHSKE